MIYVERATEREGERKRKRDRDIKNYKKIEK